MHTCCTLVARRPCTLRRHPLTLLVPRPLPSCAGRAPPRASTTFPPTSEARIMLRRVGAPLRAPPSISRTRRALLSHVRAAPRVGRRPPTRRCRAPRCAAAARLPTATRPPASAARPRRPTCPHVSLQRRAAPATSRAASWRHAESHLMAAACLLTMRSHAGPATIQRHLLLPNLHDEANVPRRARVLLVRPKACLGDRALHRPLQRPVAAILRKLLVVAFFPRSFGSRPALRAVCKRSDQLALSHPDPLHPITARPARK